MKFIAVIVAGGSGSRMNTAIPKQFLILHGRPVMMHTIEAFHLTQSKPEIFVVLNEKYFSIWKQLCKDYDFKIEHQLVAGGNTRFGSVKNALDLIDEESIIAIHDAVRPLIKSALIDLTFARAATHGNAIIAVASKDSVRYQAEDGLTKPLKRNQVFLVQTPQVFRSLILKNAYLQLYREEFTDDASVVEADGQIINIVEGHYDNIKITFPADLQFAEMILNKKSC